VNRTRLSNCDQNGIPIGDAQRLASGFARAILGADNSTDKRA
jgi:hypothetical protein